MNNTSIDDSESVETIILKTKVLKVRLAYLQEEMDGLDAWKADQKAQIELLKAQARTAQEEQAVKKEKIQEKIARMIQLMEEDS